MHAAHQKASEAFERRCELLTEEHAALLSSGAVVWLKWDSPGNDGSPSPICCIAPGLVGGARLTRRRICACASSASWWFGCFTGHDEWFSAVINKAVAGTSAPTARSKRKPSSGVSKPHPAPLN
eukprot:COSAG01_NODE_4585_length_4896_cov_11.310611_4_plen_124_part_00